MPSFTGKTFANFYKNLLGINQTTNAGADATVRTVQDGAGNNTALSLSARQVSVTNTTHDTTGAFTVTNKGGDNILAVDTINSKVLGGASQVNTLTLFKEMGLYDFSPTAGYHYPLIASNFIDVSAATAFSGDNDWGNASDPPTSLDVSGLTSQEQVIAVYWYLEDNITLDAVRFIATADGTVTLNFHLFAYDLDTSTNYGDLSNGVVHANTSVGVDENTVKTGTFTLDTADIDANKVVIGFAENASSTDDLSVQLNIKYHIR